MRFIPKPPKYASTYYSGNRVSVDYIFNTKEILDELYAQYVTTTSPLDNAKDTAQTC